MITLNNQNAKRFVNLSSAFPGQQLPTFEGCGICGGSAAECLCHLIPD